jgi:hypothetical protein
LRHGEELTLDEKYALLAALHDEVYVGERRLCPVTWPAFSAATEETKAAFFNPLHTEGAKDAIRWEALLGTVRNWLRDDEPGEYDPEDTRIAKAPLRVRSAQATPL